MAALSATIVPSTTPRDDDSPDDYRRAVIVIAVAAVGFFLPSLLIANVPQQHWPIFGAMATIGGLVLAGSFVVVPRGSRLVYPWGVLNAITVTSLGVQFGPYYHEIGLLYSLVVAAHAVVHGFGAAFLMVAIGAFAVPGLIEGGSVTPTNGTDLVYTAIYLCGIAIIPWVAGRLARTRLTEVRRHLQAVIETEREAVAIIARAAEAKDDVTGEHVVRVGDLAADLASAAGQSADFAEDLRFAAMLHDVGKLHVPDGILMKRGPLDPAELELVRTHTLWGQRILGQTSGFELARTVARSHHENWDGSGYPDHLVGSATPLAARIVHLVDVFDALRAARPYKEAWSLERAIAEIEARSGEMFDPDLVVEFLRLVRAGRVD
jgi:HD domain-containing protein